MNYGLPDVIIPLIDQKTRGNVTSVLLLELARVDKVGGLIVSKVYFVAQNVNVEKLPDILLALVSIQTLVIGELVTNLGNLDLHTLSLGVSVLTLANVRDELVQSTHGS